MQGIVSTLDKEHIAKIDAIRESLGKMLPENWSKKQFYPHFSWHVAEDYQQKQIENKIKEISSTIYRFQIQTAGLGIFTGQIPVLYLSLVQNQELLKLHKLIWTEFNLLAKKSVAYYQPNSWVPHISLAYGNSFVNHIDKVIKKYSNEDFQWEITIDNLSYIDATDDEKWILKYKSSLKF